MKTTISFTLFPVGASKDPEEKLSDLPLPLYESIASIYPDGRGKRSIYVNLPLGDARLEAIRGKLRENGYVEKGTMFREKGSGKPILMTAIVEYEKSDFGKHDWYEVRPSQMLADYASRNEQGLISNIGDRDYSLSKGENAALVAGREDSRGKIPKWATISVAAVGPYAILMGVVVSKLARESGLIIPTKPTSVSDIVEWDAKVVFPALSSVCDFRDPDGNPVSEAEERRCGHIVDGLNQSPVMKYDRVALLKFLKSKYPFDVAKTSEAFGNTVESADGLFIVSRRLAEWLLKRDAKLHLKPVDLV